MSRTVRVFQVDAFTDRQFSGNPAGVVLDADGLGEADMLCIARELNNGDTAFLLQPDTRDCDLRVRFFTPRTEAGFVGHATIAAHAVLSAIGRPPLERQRQKTGIVRVTRDPPWFCIEQPPASMQRVLSEVELAPVLDALGVTRSDLDPRAPPTIAGSGSTRLLLALGEGAMLARLSVDQAALARLSPQLGASGFFVFSLRPAVSDCGVESRMFCPALGIPEDPVSGNAHGMLAVHLHRQGLLPRDGGRAVFVGAQGHHMQRPGRVRIEVVLSNDAIECVRIAGRAVVVFETTLTL